MEIDKKFNELKQSFIDLSYEDAKQLDKLCKTAKMLILNIYGKESEHFKDFLNISFIDISFYASKEDDIHAWQSGKNEIINLFDTILEEKALFSNKNESLKEFNSLLNNNKVFIVHGHDNQAKEQVARTIEKMGLEAVILHEQVNSGKTIIEKIEANTDVGFGIVLYTPCDVGNSKSNSNELNARARQNVIFEHGFLVAKLGREKVVALVKGDIEKPSDIDGVVYEPMDNGNNWKYSLAREMRAVGYNIDMNKI